MADNSTILTAPFGVRSRERDLVIRTGRFYPNNTSAVNNASNIGLKNMTVTRLGVGIFQCVFNNAQAMKRLVFFKGNVVLATPAVWTVQRDSSLDDGTGVLFTLFNATPAAADIAASANSWVELIMYFQHGNSLLCPV